MGEQFNLKKCLKKRILNGGLRSLILRTIILEYKIDRIVIPKLRYS